MQPRRDAAQEREFANRLADALGMADSLVAALPKRPTWSEKAVLGLLQRSAYAGNAVAVLHKASCYPDTATVARVAFESMITALDILHDPDPHQRARQYTEIMLYAQLAKRRGNVLEVGITPGVPVVEGRPAGDWLKDRVEKARANCDQTYRDSGEWRVRAMCEGLGRKELYLRVYRTLCVYAHPNPSVLDRMGLEPLGAATSEGWHLAAIIGLAVAAGCLEVLNEVAPLTLKRRGSKTLRSAWPEVESFLESVFPRGSGRLLGPPPARPAPTRAPAS